MCYIYKHLSKQEKEAAVPSGKRIGQILCGTAQGERGDSPLSAFFIRSLTMEQNLFYRRTDYACAF